ncbi:hypothetical protein BJV77DRAFT_1162354, partial [Russula vinacea]
LSAVTGRKGDSKTCPLQSQPQGASQSEKPEDVVVAAAANGIRDEIEAEPLQRCREAVQEDKSNDVPPAVDGITGSDEAEAEQQRCPIRGTGRTTFPPWRKGPRTKLD